jgi:hypothetical protein
MSYYSGDSLQWLPRISALAIIERYMYIAARKEDMTNFMELELKESGKLMSQTTIGRFDSTKLQYTGTP